MSELEQNRATNLPLDPNLIAKFYSLGFKQLTEIQKKAVSIIYQKKDTLVIAPTGSGKTECSVIPIFSHIKLSKKLGKIKAIYVTPLRALNRDVFRRIVRYAENDGLSIEIRHGDTPQSTRKKISNSPPDILITTPETLVILLTQKKMLDALSELEWIVIDEVHELLGNERGSQLSLSLERLQLNSNLEITRIGLSATIGNPEESGKFVVGTKRKLKIIRDTTIRKYDVKVKYIEGTISDVAQYIIEFVTEQDLQSPVLLFTNTRGESEFLASILKEKSTLNIELHYGSPRQVSKLIQRIGRSRHSKGSSAKGLIVTNNADDEYEAHAILERIKQGSIEEQKIHDGSLDVLAHHLVGITIQLGQVSVDHAFEIFTKAYPFRNLTLDNFLKIFQLFPIS